VSIAFPHAIMSPMLVRTSVRKSLWLCLLLAGVIVTSSPAAPSGAQESVSTLHKSLGGCHRPTNPGRTHSVFYGVEGIAKPQVKESAIVSFTTRNETSRWCLLSFVIDESTKPITVHFAFLSQATRADEVAVQSFAKATALFKRVWILPTKVWVPTRAGT
jgi:hypothetical protein